MTKQAEAMFTALEGPVEAAPAELKTTGSLVEVLRERQLNKTASIFANIAAGAAQHAGTALKAFGTNPMAAGAVGGAALGGIGGAITAEEGQGMSGFLRGAAMGGALGAGAGYVAPGAMKNIGNLGKNLQRAGAEARGLTVQRTTGKVVGEAKDVAEGGLKGVTDVLKKQNRTRLNQKRTDTITSQKQALEGGGDAAKDALNKTLSKTPLGATLSGKAALGIGAASTAGAGMLGGMTTGGGNQGQVT